MRTELTTGQARRFRSAHFIIIRSSRYIFLIWYHFFSFLFINLNVASVLWFLIMFIIQRQNKIESKQMHIHFARLQTLTNEHSSLLTLAEISFADHLILIQVVTVDRKALLIGLRKISNVFCFFTQFTHSIWICIDNCIQSRVLSSWPFVSKNRKSSYYGDQISHPIECSSLNFLEMYIFFYLFYKQKKKKKKKE